MELMQMLNKKLSITFLHEIGEIVDHDKVEELQQREHQDNSESRK